MNMAFKIFSVWFVTVFACLPAGELQAQRANQAYLVRTFEVPQPELVEILTSGGFIKVLGSDRDDVRVEMYVRRNNRYLQETDMVLDDFEIEIEQVNNVVRASARRDRQGRGGWFNGNSNINISFIVYTPRQSEVEARTSGGSITAESLVGDMRLRTSGGSLTMKELSGVIRARTSGGSISIEDIEGDLEARTSGGSIRASDGSGRVDLRTSGGSITLEEFDGSVSARTSGGSIRAKMIGVEEHVDLRTSGGNITIEIPGEGGYDIDLTGTRVRTELRNFSGTVEENRVVGKILEGGASISARTSGGTVRIHYL